MTTISVAPTLNNPSPNIVAMRELISAYSHGAESPIYQQRLEEATTVLGVKASLLQILCENWLTLIKDEIAVSTAVETDDAKLSVMGMVNGLTINQRVCAHLKNEFATPIRNEAEALLWVNLKAFERFAQKVQGLDSLAKQTPLCLLTMILGFATQAVKDEYADNLPKLKKHLISYLQYVVDVLQKTYNANYPDLVA